MTSKRNLTCIVCPLGCSLEVAIENSQVVKVEGNSCRRGIAYAESECTNPTRILTTTIRVKNGKWPLVSVKSDQPLPKGLLLDCMQIINQTQVNAPVKIGDVLVKDILGTGVNIVATRNVNKENMVEKNKPKMAC